MECICIDVNENQRKEDIFFSTFVTFRFLDVYEHMEKKRVQTLIAVRDKIDPRLKDLVVDGRYLLRYVIYSIVCCSNDRGYREGVLNQFDVDDDQIKERYYFLFNDILLISRKQKNKYAMRVHITLNTVRLKDIPDSQSMYISVFSSLGLFPLYRFPWASNYECIRNAHTIENNHVFGTHT